MSESNGTADAGPFAEQQRLFKLLSQDTRHLIIQELLGHPAHLMSLAELEYMVGKSQAAIKDQVETLIEAGILAQYTYEPAKGNETFPRSSTGLPHAGLRFSTTTNISVESRLPARCTRIRGRQRKSSDTKQHHVQRFPRLSSKHSPSTNQTSSE
ncbi:hypothetical protein ACFQH3_12090 [Haladaptatus sp. GCM10025707]|uniref:hypothetical protein n=1 Tax=Haladaptatus sp. GCM10025707 TaxID=3252658 RepID=UPI00360D033F